VLLRGGGWQVLRTTTYTDCAAIHLAPTGSGRARTFLLPFDRPRSRPPATLAAVSRRRWARHVSALIVSSFPFGGLRACPAGIRLLPYQLEPALAMLRHGALRVLVADDVGLGKTVEAGLVAGEILRADHLARVLILCPAPLRTQWAEELDAHFHLQPIDADSAWLRRMALEVPRDVNPWSLPGAYLSSIDFVKRPEALRPLEDVRWDLLVLDEAHVATLGSDRRAAASALAARSRRLMLLTATPHSGDEEQFRSLCGLGSAPGVPLTLFSRDRTHAGLPSLGLRCTVLPVALSEAERESHRLLQTYAAQLWRSSERCREAGGALLATLLMKRALSSPVSLAVSIRRRRALLRGGVTMPAQLALPLGDPVVEDEACDAVLGTRVLDHAGDEGRVLDAIAQAADVASGDERKLRAVIRLLRRTRERALIFTEYRDTAERLRDALCAHGLAAALLHGGLTPRERRQAIGALAAGRAHLVATDAASEGLNLHQGCRLVVHFELPWTPLRLHQRCGRVNRIGQMRRVHEIALVARDTAESLVLAPLLDRARQAGTLARAPLLQQLTESIVAAHVLDASPIRLSAAAMSPQIAPADLRAEARAEAERLEAARRLTPAGRCATPPRRRTRSCVPVAEIRGRHAYIPRGLHFVYSLWIRTRSGTALAHEIAVLSSTAPLPGWPRGGLLAAVRAIHLALEPELAARIASALAKRIEQVRVRHVDACRLAGKRAAHATPQRHSTAQALVQAGLFDRRALRAAAARQRAEAAAREADDHHEPSADCESVEGTYELRAVLVSRPR